MWAEKEVIDLSKAKEVPFAMLADTNSEVAKLYDTFDENDKLTLRGSFIIDPDGNVLSADVGTTPLGRNYDEILRKIRALQTIRESNGTQATPCCWVPGEAALQPSIQLVGNMAQAWTFKSYQG